MSGRRRERSRSPDRRHHDSRSRDRPQPTRGGPPPSSSHIGLPGSFRLLDESELPSLPSRPMIPSAGERLPTKSPLRPQNRDGTETEVLTNHFAIISLPHPSKTKVYQYDLRLTVPKNSQHRGSEDPSKQQAARAMLKVQASKHFGPNFVFDGVSKGYSTAKFVPGKEVKSITIDMDGHSPEKPNQVHVDIRMGQVLNFGALIRYLQDNNIGLHPVDAAARECICALIAIMHDYPANHLKMFSPPHSNAYFKRWKSLISPLPSTGGVLEAIRGVFQSVAVVFGGQLTVNVDTRCSAFFVPGPSLLHVALAFAGIEPGGRMPDMEDLLSTADRLIGVGFVLNHLQNKSRVYWVKAVTTTNAIDTRFDEKIGGETVKISVAQYFHEKYRINLQYPELPLVQTHHQGVFPLELCFVADDIRYKELLQSSETSDFIAACTVAPPIRKNQIYEHVRRLRWHQQPLLQDIGISVETSMLEVKARLLQAPQVVYRRGTDQRPPADGSWNLMNKEFMNPKSFKSWALLYIPGRRPIPDIELQRFCKDITNGANATGLSAPTGPPAFLRGSETTPVRRMIHELLDNAKRAFKEKPVLFFMLHSGQHPSIYKAIKNVCDLEGYVSQCMLAESALNPKGVRQYAGNIAMKLNVKLGGTNHIVRERFFEEPTMMLGADVSHPSPEELRTVMPPPSYAALVGSMDENCAFYSAVTMGLSAKQELIPTLAPMFEVLLRRFEKKHNIPPKKVIYWRDGIGDTQIDAFKETELQALLDFRKENHLSFKLTVILCVKRHHTRFFPKDLRIGDRKGNVPPGTMVENGVKCIDFFAITQKVIQGTGRPTRYSVVYDELQMSMSDVQRLVMSGCFSYARASRSVGLHSAAYHADIVADKARLHLSSNYGRTILKEVHDDLKSSMWWQ